MKLDTTFRGGGGANGCAERDFNHGQVKKLIGEPARTTIRRPKLSRLLGKLSTTKPLPVPEHIRFSTICSCSPPMKEAKMCVFACLLG